MRNLSFRTLGEGKTADKDGLRAAGAGLGIDRVKRSLGVNPEIRVLEFPDFADRTVNMPSPSADSNGRLHRGSISVLLQL